MKMLNVCSIISKYMNQTEGIFLLYMIFFIVIFVISEKARKIRLLFIFWFSANEHGKRLVQGWKVILVDCKLQHDNCCYI